MQRYRKIPVEVEAVQYDGTNHHEIAAWSCGSVEYLGHRILRIRTLEGVMSCQPPTWVVKGVEGEFYPVKDSVFEATYEPI